MKKKLYKHYRKPSYFHLRKMGYISFSVTILMMGILIPLSLISVGAYQQHESSSSTEASSVTSEVSETSTEEETSEIADEDIVIYAYSGLTKSERVWLWK
jgi:cytochrome c-type biogenesis protein CcmH/NrfG